MQRAVLLAAAAVLGADAANQVARTNADRFGQTMTTKPCGSGRAAECELEINVPSELLAGHQQWLWSPAGPQIVFAAKDGLLLLNPLTGQDEVWLKPVGKHTTLDAAYSADGARLAHSVVFDGGASQVTVWDTATWTELLVYQGQRGDRVAFSPDGTKLAVAKWQSIHIVKVSDGSLELAITTPRHMPFAISWSPDATSLLLSIQATQNNIYRYDAATGRGQRIISAMVTQKIDFVAGGKLMVLSGYQGVATYNYPSLDRASVTRRSQLTWRGVTRDGHYTLYGQGTFVHAANVVTGAEVFGRIGPVGVASDGLVLSNDEKRFLVCLVQCYVWRVSLPALPAYFDQAPYSALQAIRNRLTTTGSVRLQQWTGTDYCAYPSVTCNAAKAVTAIRLDGETTLRADVPELTALSELSVLVLKDTQARVSHWRLPQSLTEVDISNTPVNARMPGSLAGLRNLVVLRARNTGMSGYLTLSPKLVLVDASDNELQYIPNTLPDTLRTLNVRNNKIESRLPASNTVRHIVVSNNRITGTIPTYPEARTLFVHQNELTGGYSPSMTPLGQRIDVSANKLTGAAPNFFGTTVRWFQGSHNSFTGPFPFAAASQTPMERYVVNHNKLSGRAPTTAEASQVATLCLFVGNDFN